MSVLKNLSYKVQLIITKTRPTHICYITDLTSESHTSILLKEKDLNYKFQNPLLWRGPGEVLHFSFHLHFRRMYFTER